MNAISMIRITFTIIRTCRTDYYSRYSECDVYCIRTATYSCGAKGDKICNKGYYVVIITSIII